MITSTRGIVIALLLGLAIGSATHLPRCKAAYAEGVPTISRVAEQLGEDEDWLSDVASEMEIEDGVIWVYGVGEHGIMAFTDFGIENLIELIRMHKENPDLLKHLHHPE